MSDRPGRTAPARRRRALLIGGVLIVVAAGVVLVLVLKGGGSKPGTKCTGPPAQCNPSPQTPPFKFKLASAAAIPTSKHTSDVAAVATKEAGEIRQTLDRMYALAFLDPNDWQHGAYDAVLGFFDAGRPALQAQRDEPILTLGARAGDLFTKVLPAGGTLKVRVLLDKGGHPFTAVADAVFHANATRKNGTHLLVVSTAHYFMHIQEGGWMISAYTVTRTDRPVLATGKGGPTGSPTS